MILDIKDLPTPVGPTNKKLAIGLFGSLKPKTFLCKAKVNCSTASS